MGTPKQKKKPKKKDRLSSSCHEKNSSEASLSISDLYKKPNSDRVLSTKKKKTKKQPNTSGGDKKSSTRRRRSAGDIQVAAKVLQKFFFVDSREKDHGDESANTEDTAPSTPFIMRKTLDMAGNLSVFDSNHDKTASTMTMSFPTIS